MKIIHSQTITQTRELARKLARDGGKRVFALVGDLGSGKTTFTQAFLKALGVKGRITSPTFLIIKSYTAVIARSEATKQSKKGVSKKIASLRHPPTSGGEARNDKLAVYHIDAYRIKKASELTALGLKNLLKDKNNIVLIEWADKIKQLLPKDTVWIYFKYGSVSKERIIEFKM